MKFPKYFFRILLLALFFLSFSKTELQSQNSSVLEKKYTSKKTVKKPLKKDLGFVSQPEKRIAKNINSDKKPSEVKTYRNTLTEGFKKASVSVKKEQSKSSNNIGLKTRVSQSYNDKLYESLNFRILYLKLKENPLESDLDQITILEKKLKLLCLELEAEDCSK